MKSIRNRLHIANLHGGGILMTTLILVAGYSTPRVLRRVCQALGIRIGANERRVIGAKRAWAEMLDVMYVLN
jgi:hypothetical protein